LGCEECEVPDELCIDPCGLCVDESQALNRESEYMMIEEEG
jgi:hypothetical protein